MIWSSNFQAWGYEHPIMQTSSERAPGAQSSPKLTGPRRLDGRQLKARLAWFAAAYVLIAVCATTVAGDLKGLPDDPPSVAAAKAYAAK
jgi:hypothetical protein